MSPQSSSWGFPRWKGYGKGQETTVTKSCDWHDCDRMADCRAPKSPRQLNEYFWFCQDHAEEYNRSWDYFRGMSSEQIYEEERNAQWVGPQSQWDTVDDSLAHYDPETRAAMAALGLEPGAGLDELKNAYKAMAKKHHPDLGGDQERFKLVTAAYNILLARLKQP